MRLYEYEAKQLYKQFKLPAPESMVAANLDDVSKAVDEIGLPVVIKAQVLTGGRGKAGGIKKADVAGQVKSLANDIFDMTIKGFPVEKILIEKAVDIKQEIYLGITLNRADYKVTVIASAEGGVDIEEVARKSPEKRQKKGV